MRHTRHHIHVECSHCREARPRGVRRGTARPRAARAAAAGPGAGRPWPGRDAGGERQARRARPRRPVAWRPGRRRWARAAAASQPSANPTRNTVDQVVDVPGKAGQVATASPPVCPRVFPSPVAYTCQRRRRAVENHHAPVGLTQRSAISLGLGQTVAHARPRTAVVMGTACTGSSAVHGETASAGSCFGRAGEEESRLGGRRARRTRGEEELRFIELVSSCRPQLLAG